MAQTEQAYNLIIFNSCTLRSSPVTSYKGTYSGNFLQYWVADIVEYRGIDYQLTSLPTGDPPGPGWKYLQTHTALKLQRGNRSKFTFDQTEMYVSTYEGINVPQGYNDVGFNGNCAYISSSYNGVELSKLDYVSIKIQALSRRNANGSAVSTEPALNDNRFMIDDYLYLNLVVDAQSDGIQVIEASYKSGALDNGTNNPSGLPLDGSIQEITFEPADAIWYIRAPSSPNPVLGLTASGSLQFQGSGPSGMSLNNFTRYADATFTNSSDPQAPNTESLNSIVIRMGNCNNTELRDYRILNLKFSVDNIVSHYDLWVIN